MASEICVRRLTKELKALKKDPITQPRISVAPNEANILEMHYVIEGSAGTPYDGGVYHGKLIFPKEYPLKPPGVMMMTPSGRFQPNRRLCLSMSDFHPESWCPMWSVSTILTGLYSFMIETNPTLGSIETSTRKKRQLAAASLEWNVKSDPTFCRLFPEFVERHEEEERLRRQQEQAQQQQQQSQSSVDLAGSSTGGRLASGAAAAAGAAAALGMQRPRDGMPQALLAALAGIAAILSILAAVRFY